MHRQALSRKLARAAISGGLVAAFNFSCLWLFLHFFGVHSSFSFAFLLALAAHFTLSKFWTFGDRSPAWRRQLPQYLMVAAVSYLVQFLIVHACIDFFNLNPLIASLFAIPASTFTGFFLMQIWVFSTSPPPSEFTTPRRGRLE
jgi:putative flippase GtrA